jgi:hypothetical protein
MNDNVNFSVKKMLDALKGGKKRTDTYDAYFKSLGDLKKPATGNSLTLIALASIYSMNMLLFTTSSTLPLKIEPVDRRLNSVGCIALCSHGDEYQLLRQKGRVFENISMDVDSPALAYIPSMKFQSGDWFNTSIASSTNSGVDSNSEKMIVEQ